MSAIVLMLSGVATACGGGGAVSAGDPIRGTRLTVYASVPLSGASQPSAQAVVNGATLALRQAHGRIGRYRITLKALNDSAPGQPGWDPGQTTVNAHVAVQDPTTVGYLGEYNSGASAVSIPLLDRVGIPEISPMSTAVGLTSVAAGAAPGEPDKYYPTGIRNFARVIPSDAVQASVQVQLQKSLGCRTTYVVDDGEVDGQDMADSFQLVARSAGLDVVGVQAFERRATDYAPFADSVAQSRPDCVLVSALTESGAAAVTARIAAALPSARIFGTAGVAERTFTDPAAGGIPLDLDPRVIVTAPALGPPDSPPAAALFDAAYARHYGPPPPSAVCGYEAMSLLLSAISRASDHGRAPVRRSRVVADIFRTRARDSVLGPYSIDRNGDTTLRHYGVYRLAAGALEYWKALGG